MSNQIACFADLPELKYLVFDGAYGITPDYHFGYALEAKDHRYRSHNTLRAHVMLSPKDIIATNKGKVTYGFFERWGMPSVVDGGEDKKHPEKIEQRKKARQTMLDYIRPNPNSKVMSRLVFDIDQDNIPIDEYDKIVFSWTTIHDNLQCMFGSQFQQSDKPVIYSMIGYSTIEAFNMFFKDIKDSFKDIQYEDVDIQTKTPKTFKAKYLIDESHIFIIELRDNKEEAGHVFSAHIVPVNAFFNIDDFTHLEIHKYDFYGCDPLVYTRYRNMRCQWSVKCRMFSDSKTHKRGEYEGLKLTQSYNKAVHHKGIIKSLMSDCQNAADIWCKLFLAGYYTYDELPSDFEQKYIVINFNGFATQTTSLIPEELKERAKNNRIKRIPVASKKINNNLIDDINQFTPLHLLLAGVRQCNDGNCYLYFKDHSIFEIFNYKSCYGFVGNMRQLYHDNIIYFPYDSFYDEVKKWYNQTEHKHSLDDELIPALTEDNVKLIEEIPKIEGASSLNKLRNLYYNYLYQNNSFLEVEEAFKSVKEKLYKKKKCTSKEVDLIKSVIRETVANLTEFQGYDYDDVDHFKPLINEPEFKPLLDMNVAEIEHHSEMVSILNLKDDWILIHYKQVLERLNIIFKQVHERNHEDSIVKKNIMDYIETYVIDKWYNELLQIMLENKYKTSLATGIYDKLYYTVNRKQYYHIVKQKTKSKEIVEHIEENKEDVIANLTPKGSKKIVSIDLLNLIADYTSQEELLDKLQQYKQEYILGKINSLRLDKFLESSVETPYYGMLQKWLVQYRNTFTCEDDFNFCLSWYAHKLNGECLDRHMLNYGNADCLKSTLCDMCERAGYDFYSVNSHQFVDKFNASFKDHTALCIEEFEKLDKEACGQFVEEIKAMYGKDTIVVQDKNVKSHRIIHRIDYDITTNETSYAAINIFTGNVQAVLKRICPIERKPLSQTVIQDKELFPVIKDDPTALTFFMYWLKNVYPKWSKERILKYRINVSQVELARDVQESKYTKLTDVNYTNEGRYSVINGVRQLVKERQGKYYLQFGQIKLFRSNVLKNLNIEIYPEFNNISELKQFMKSDLDIQFSFHSNQMIVTKENLDKWFNSFSLVTYDELHVFEDDDHTYYKTPDWTAITNRINELLNKDIQTEETIKASIRSSEECIKELLQTSTQHTSETTNQHTNSQMSEPPKPKEEPKVEPPKPKEEELFKFNYKDEDDDDDNADDGIALEDEDY